jgi:hypothetical protein
MLGAMVIFFEKRAFGNATKSTFEEGLPIWLLYSKP